MRRKYLILASCIISALLLTFTFHVSADENVTADAGASSNSAPLLDSYFWENYDLLPYIESDGSQYIDSGIYLDQDCIVNARFSPLVSNVNNAVFGFDRSTSQNDRYYLLVNMGSDNTIFAFGSGFQSYTNELSLYTIYSVSLGEEVYINNNLVHTFANINDFTTEGTCYIFARNISGSPSTYARIRLYSFSIYDGEDYVRYYYPAKSKFGDVIGLYDAVSKTFVTTGGSEPFANPTDDKVLHFQIGDFITNGIDWITDILEFAIEEPVILMFMAIGLCGVAFRWARRVVHF